MSGEASRAEGIGSRMQPAEPAASVSQAKRVLVIDDDRFMQDMLKNYLEQHNLRVVLASQKQDRTRLSAASEPNIVILDLRLGQEDGLGLLREIRSNSDGPVIITLGHRSDEIRRAGDLGR